MRSKSESRKYASPTRAAEKRGSGFQAPYLKIPEGIQLFKPKAGSMLLDILPYKVGEGNKHADEGMLYYERTFWVHRGIGANNDSQLCLARTFKEPCPICEHRLKLMKNVEDSNEDLIKDLEPKQRQLFNVVNVKEPDKRFIWDISYHLFGKLLDTRLLSADEEDDWESFAHLDGGSTLKVTFAEDSYGGRSFMTAETIDFKSRKTDYDEDVLEEVACLDKILVPLDYDDLKKLFLQTVDEDEEGKASKRKKSKDDDDDDDEPKSRKSKDDDDDDDEPKGRKKKSKDDDDDDDDEPKSRKSKDDDDDDEPKGRKKSKDDDDDWDDFDKNGEDDDEPKGRKKSKDDDDDDDEPKSRKSKDDDDDDDEPKKKKKGTFDKDDDDKGWDKDDDDDEPRKKKKVKAGDDDDDD